MVLIVFLSSRISPCTSTVIFLERSPLATAVVTSAMLRTWPVRLLAIRLTLSVRSFQVPATPFTEAWPPSFPSVPTSRATRVTSSAKALSWSTMVLIVFLSSSTSPRACTVIFRDRSPLATAVVTSAMLRTWSVRLLAIAFTESVRSFQVPATPGTFAWPPSRPSVPTSRATRVTSAANDESWSTMVFTVVPIRRNSPCTIFPSICSTIFCDRSPCATASITRPTSVVGVTRSVMSEFTAVTVRAHPPSTGPRSARSVICPSRPTHVLVGQPLAQLGHLVEGAGDLHHERAPLLGEPAGEPPGAHLAQPAQEPPELPLVGGAPVGAALGPALGPVIGATVTAVACLPGCPPVPVAGAAARYPPTVGGVGDAAVRAGGSAGALARGAGAGLARPAAGRTPAVRLGGI